VGTRSPSPWVVFLVSAGVAAVAVVLSREAVLLVYQRGAFTIDDTMRTASALSAFCLGVPSGARRRSFRGFFAMRDTWTRRWWGPGPGSSPSLYYLLQQSYGVFGLALASTAGSSSTRQRSTGS